MLVNNHKLQLKEASRVLQKGSKAGFTIWGKRENTNFFTLIGKVFKKHDLIPLPLPERTYFTLNDDLPSLKRDFEEAGFTNFKYWH